MMATKDYVDEVGTGTSTHLHDIFVASHEQFHRLQGARTRGTGMTGFGRHGLRPGTVLWGETLTHIEIATKSHTSDHGWRCRRTESLPTRHNSGLPPRSGIVAMFEALPYPGKPTPDDIDDTNGLMHCHFVFLGVYKKNKGALLRCTAPMGWVDPMECRAYTLLGGDPVLRLMVARFDMHVGAPRDDNVCPHINKHGIMTHDKDPVSCVLDYLRRLNRFAPRILYDNLIDTTAYDPLFIVEWVRTHEQASLIPGEEALVSILNTMVRGTAPVKMNPSSENKRIRTDILTKTPAVVPVVSVPPVRSKTSFISTKTQYKENTYESRLEARWAMVFDLLDMRFTYEGIMVTSVHMEMLLRPHGNGKYYKPDMFLQQVGVAVEIKPTYPSTHERLLAAEFARSMGPIIVLFGGSGAGYTQGSLFRFPVTAVRDRTVCSPGGVPLGIMYTRDEERPSGVRVEHVALGRVGSGWGFVPLADADQDRTPETDTHLRTVFDTAAKHFL